VPVGDRVQVEIEGRPIRSMVRHSGAEETYVHPVVRDQLPDSSETVEQDVEEHRQLERTMKELEGCDTQEGRFMELVGELRNQLHHHATDEESTQFPAVRARVPDEHLVKMREQVERAKKLAPTRPHPGAPNSQVFHKMVGPGVGLMDRRATNSPGEPPLSSQPRPATNRRVLLLYRAIKMPSAHSGFSPLGKGHIARVVISAT
jgi:hemerythrin superfamily protein